MPDTHSLPPAVFLIGPTASGKSRLALELVEHFPFEIISIDSAQVYRHMNIGTAKPDPAILARIPHHLINVIDPHQVYSAAQFREDALQLMQQITQRGRIPLLTGGTMMYVRALCHGLSDLPAADLTIRHKIEQDAKEKGWQVLHQMLAQHDPVAAARIKPSDSQRIQRALEVYYLTGMPMSVMQRTSLSNSLPYRTIQIALIPSERALLHVRIAQRFTAMLQEGLLDEVQWLRETFPLTLDSPAMRCVGYRQACLYLDNHINYNELHDTGIAATRQLAKRQLTWLRSMEKNELHILDCLTDNLMIQLKQFLQETIQL